MHVITCAHACDHMHVWYLDSETAHKREDLHVVEHAAGVQADVVGGKEGAWHSQPPCRAHHFQDGVLHVRERGKRAVHVRWSKTSFSEFLIGH